MMNVDFSYQTDYFHAVECWRHWNADFSLDFVEISVLYSVDILPVVDVLLSVMEVSPVLEILPVVVIVFPFS